MAGSPSGDTTTTGGTTDGGIAGDADADHPDADHPDAADADAVPFVVDDDLATRVANARTRHGRAGGMLAAGMLGLDQVVNGRKPREEIPVVVDAAGEPTDIDRDGIRVRVDGADGTDHIELAAPPLPSRAPFVAPGTRGGRRRWR